MSKSRLWTVPVAVALALGTIGFASCGGDSKDGGGGGANDFALVSEGKLLVGTDTPYPPFEIGQPPDISGYDIDIVKEIGKRLGLEVTFQDTAFDTSRRDVAQGKFDAVVAATTITPEREGAIDFSDPYYEAEQALLVTQDSDIATVDDLSGAIVGAQDGTTGEDYANDETDASEVRGFPEGPDAINALNAGQVDAVIIDQPVAQDAVDSGASGELVIAETIPTAELYGIVIAPDNDALREAINKALTKIKKDGTLTKLYQQYFKIKPPKSVLNGTHEPT